MSRVILKASEGMVLTNGESYGTMVFLGSGDSPDNWYEVTKEVWQHKLEQEALRCEEDLY